MCLSLSLSASWTQGARSLGVRLFHFLPVKTRLNYMSNNYLLSFWLGAVYDRERMWLGAVLNVAEYVLFPMVRDSAEFDSESTYFIKPKYAGNLNYLKHDAALWIIVPDRVSHEKTGGIKSRNTVYTLENYLKKNCFSKSDALKYMYSILLFNNLDRVGKENFLIDSKHNKECGRKHGRG